MTQPNPSETNSKQSKAACYCRLDRTICVYPRAAGAALIRKVPDIAGFKSKRNVFIQHRGARIQAYRQVRIFENPASGAKVYVQHDRAHGWLKRFRITIVGNDSTGITWPDLEAISAAFGHSLRITLVELAFDFGSDSRVDADFVLKHALFGKSRPNHNPKYPGSLRYGTRHSAKMVRCYWKVSVDAFRVELELHATWLGLPQTDCLLYLLPLGKDDFRFVDVDWNALDAHLVAKGRTGVRTSANARHHYLAIHELLGYLRSNGVNNPHRFLRLSRKDKLIREALDAWCHSFSPQERRKTLAHEEN